MTPAKKPFRIVLVGRPNVGKSSLFNALLGYRRSIVLDMPGTTRDEVAELVDWGDGNFQFVDCFGAAETLEVDDVVRVLRKADACLFVVDAIAGITPVDRELALIIQREKTTTLLVANKVDTKKSESALSFAELGFDTAVDTSAAHRRGLGEVRAWMMEQVKSVERPEKVQGRRVKLALIGRPNAGKSTLMNRLSREQVSRVSPEPLTTRDPVMFDLPTKQGTVRLVDTAGVRRPRSDKTDVEQFSIHATTRQIEQADVVFLLVDASGKVSDQDMRLLNLVERQGRPAVILLNFWDRIKPSERKKWWEESEFVPLLERFPTLTLSGKTGWNVDKLIPLAWELAEKAVGRIPTSRLNRLVENIVAKNPPPSIGRGNFNVLYASQVRSEPPTFVLFVNRKQSLPASYQRYISENLRKALELKGQALRVFFREARGKATKGH